MISILFEHISKGVKNCFPLIIIVISETGPSLRIENTLLHVARYGRSLCSMYVSKKCLSNNGARMHPTICFYYKCIDMVILFVLLYVSTEVSQQQWRANASNSSAAAPWDQLSFSKKWPKRHSHGLEIRFTVGRRLRAINYQLSTNCFSSF